MGPDQLQLGSLAHEQASVLLSSGYRFSILNHGDFAQRYGRMMQEETKRASRWNHVPLVGSFVAAHKTEKAGEDMQPM